MRRNYTKKRNSIKFFLTSAVLVAVAVGTILYFANKDSSDAVIAKVNNKKIYKSEIERKIASVFSFNGDDAQVPQLESLPVEVVEAFVKEIYFEKELASRARKSKAAKDPELKARIKETENKIITSAYLDSIIREKITDEKISQKYAELSNEISGKKEFSLSHIVLKDKEEADKIYKSLTDKKAKKSQKFSDLAKKNSLDKDSAAKGGSLGYILEDNVLKEIAEILPKMKKGDISQPVKTKFGWHIVKLDDIREPEALPFESVKEKIKEQIIRTETNEIYNNIFKDAKIKIMIEDRLKKQENAESKEQTNQQENEQNQESTNQEQPIQDSEQKAQ